MDEYEFYNDLDEIEIIELDEPIEEGIVNIQENEDGVAPSFTLIDEDEYVEPVDLSTVTFATHTKPVFQGVLNSAGTVAVTGGADDVAYAWSTETGEVILECSGHKDSVTQIIFNMDEKLLATGDMSGLIQVWDFNDKKLIWCYEGEDLEWLLWHPKVNVLFAGCQSGHIFFWQIPQGKCKVLASRGASSMCGHILSDGIRLLSGYSDGQVLLWDIKSCSVTWSLQQNHPQSAVHFMDVTKDESLLILSPSAQLFKISDGSLVTTLLSANEVDVEVVSFNTDVGLLATGAISGTACIWDYKTNSIRHQAQLGCSITSMVWGLDDTLVIGTTDSNIYIVHAKTGNLIQTLTGHKLDILSLSLSKEKNVILSTSDDCTAKIFAITNSC